VEFRILGPLEVLADRRVLSIQSSRQRALLALLVMNANRVLSPDRILDAVWADQAPASGTKVLAFHVSRLRDALAPGRRAGEPTGGLETEAGGYVLRVDPDAIDAARFERLAREAHRRLPVEPAAARSQLDEALGLWRGDALVDVAYAEFAQPEIRRLEELRLGALEDRLDVTLALGGHLEVVGELEDLLASNPLRERIRGLLMLALYRSGRQAEALRVAGIGRRLLSEELGIDPSPELVRLEAQILAQDPGLQPLPAGRGARAGRARNPYKGLRAFGEADRGDFFGREALVARLVSRLEGVAHAGRLLAVVGPSGSGKSSVVRAGLIPALQANAGADGGRWRTATMVPGVAPVRELAAALATAGHPVAEAAADRAELTGDLAAVLGAALPTDGSRLLLVIDQLEELFVLVDEEARDRFLAGLAAALTAPGTPLVIVATLRADFLHVPLGLADVGELIRRGTELVAPLTRAELERAIVRPAEAVGVEVEPALVVEIVNDVEHRPGVLPLLEYALTELFDRSDGRRLTRDGYAAIGGAIGALGRRADEAWQSLDASGRELAQQVLLALVELADAGVATARRVPRNDLESLAPVGDRGRVGAILDDLGRRGLLTFDRDRVSGAPTVEIPHEALLLHWRRLADWIEDLRDDLRMRLRLADTAHEWEEAGRSPGDLAAGARLDRFEAWAHGTRLRLTETEQAFLSASVAERDRLRKLESERAAHERGLEGRARVVRRALVAVLVVGIVLAGGLSAALVGEQQAAVEQDSVAAARQLASWSIASLGTNPQLSVLLALEAADATVSRGYVVEEAYDALHWALQDAQVTYPAGQLPVGVRAAPDGPRGVYLVAPEELMRLGAGSVLRQLRYDECRTYLHADSCPAVKPPASGVSLDVRTGSRVVPAASLASSALTGTHVRVLSELPADISPLVVPFELGSGVHVDWHPAAGGDLEARIDAREIPDVAIVSRPSYVAAAARDGWLLDLDRLIDTTSLGAEAGAYAMGLGTAAGPASSGGSSRRYALPLAASVDDLLWYPKTAFAGAGYEPPTTLAELRKLVAAIKADGRVPWCLGTEAGSSVGSVPSAWEDDLSTGSAAAAWLENLLLDEQGPSLYDGWVAGDVAFGSPPVDVAYDAFAELLANPGDVRGGLKSAAWTAERVAALPMLLADGPECWLYHGASTDRASFPASLAAVPFPGAASSSPAVLGRLYMVVVLHDRPEVRQLVQALVGAPLATAMASGIADEGIFPVRAVAPPTDGVAALQLARLRVALSDGTFRVRGVDLFPEKVASAFLLDVSYFLKVAYMDGSPPNPSGWDWGADAAWPIQAVWP
jgi:DNA-binding SARP family transcriptional activator